jgi:hypothetical protein
LRSRKSVTQHEPSYRNSIRDLARLHEEKKKGKKEKRRRLESWGKGFKLTQLKHFDLLQSVYAVQHEQITKGIFFHKKWISRERSEIIKRKQYFG